MNYIFLISVIAVIAMILGIAAFSNFTLDNEHYDRLKYLVRRWSYITVFVGLLAKTFDIPHGVETVTVVAGIGALLAGLMDISTSNWKLDQPQQTFNGESFESMTEVDDEKENDMSV